MTSSSACLAAATRAWLAAAPTRGPAALAAVVGPLVCRARALSSSAAASITAGGSGGGGGAAAPPGTPDAFTAALQQKTEEELRHLALQQGQPHVAEASSAPGEQQQQGSAPSDEVRGGQPASPWRRAARKHLRWQLLQQPLNAAERVPPIH